MSDLNDYLGDGVASILHHETTIYARLDVLARQITEDYRGKEITALAVLHGSIIFMADLLRRIPLPLQMESLNVSSYHGGTESSGTVTFHQSLPDLRGKHVLVMDDILDTGRTLHAIRQRIMEEMQPASFRVCVLLQKRKERAKEVEADYVGFEIDDEFVVGYGLDYQGRYRNLPYIGVLNESALP
ncbi:MAG: hypoxanthine phosphoribosyltransferase [Verrucomicrobiales bacterium]|jgi:hypoxanthine phosphoribosyltransferase